MPNRRVRNLDAVATGSYRFTPDPGSGLSRFARVGVASAASASSLPSPSFDVDAARLDASKRRTVVAARARRSAPRRSARVEARVAVAVAVAVARVAVARIVRVVARRRVATLGVARDGRRDKARCDAVDGDFVFVWANSVIPKPQVGPRL